MDAQHGQHHANCAAISTNQKMTTEPNYKFTVTIDDGYATWQYEYGHQTGALSISDIDQAILRAHPELRPLVSRHLGQTPQCQPTQSSPSLRHTASASNVAGPATPATGAPPAEFGRLSVEQLQRLDNLLLGNPYHLSGPALTELLSLLWKIVRPGAMKAAGISTCPATQKQNDSANNG